MLRNFNIKIDNSHLPEEVIEKRLFKALGLIINLDNTNLNENYYGEQGIKKS